MMNLGKSSIYYKTKKNDTELIDLQLDKAEKHPQEGFWKSYNRLRLEGHTDNHKRVYRVYKLLRLHIRKKAKKRLPARVKEPIVLSESTNQVWSIDFMHDSLLNGRKIKTFNVLDDYNRESLHIEINHSIKSSTVVWELNRLIKQRSKPHTIRMDNGPEFIAKIALQWSEMHGIDFKHIQPGKPTQNALIERFNKTYRNTVLDACIFDDLNQVRELTAEFIDDYNNKRPLRKYLVPACLNAQLGDDKPHTSFVNDKLSA